VNCFTPKGESQVASLVRRVEAAITTAVPLVLFVVVGFWAIGTVFPLDMYLQHYGLTAQQSEWLSFILVLSLPPLWVVFDGGIARSTYGMRKRKIRFGNIDGSPISRGRCILRIIAGIITIPLFPASWVMAIMDERHRTVADRMCRTVVWTEASVV